MQDFELSDEEVTQLNERTHPRVEPAIYFIGQMFYDILETLDQTDEDTQNKLKMLFMLYDENDPRIASMDDQIN